MIAYATCVADQETYDDVCVPALGRTAGPSDLLIAAEHAASHAEAHDEAPKPARPATGSS